MSCASVTPYAVLSLNLLLLFSIFMHHWVVAVLLSSAIKLYLIPYGKSPSPPANHSFLPFFFVISYSIKSIHPHSSFYQSNTRSLPAPHPFRLPCLSLISPTSFIHHTSFLYISCTNQLLSPAPSFFPSIILELSLILLRSLHSSITSGCSVLHPGSLFRVITCLVNTFTDSNVSDARWTHVCSYPKQSPHMHIKTIGKVQLWYAGAYKLSTRRNSEEKRAISQLDD